jgi:hypothetical protein
MRFLGLWNEGLNNLCFETDKNGVLIPEVVWNLYAVEVKTHLGDELLENECYRLRLNLLLDCLFFFNSPLEEELRNDALRVQELLYLGRLSQLAD